MQSPSQTGHKHPFTVTALVGAVGIVFGDIGTSPLYAFKESFRVAYAGGIDLHTSVFGVLSLIFWALTITISIKYLCFILRADNDGEGGVFALITGLKLDKKKNKTRFSATLLLLALAGAALLFGDGVITPAISVLSAIEGIKVVAPSIEHWILYITIAVLIGVFMSQRFGTEKIGMLYGPIVFVWFVVLGVLGANAIIDNPQVLKAVNPVYAWHILVGHPAMSAVMVGAVFLAVTGGEALYADMGHFGAKVIRYAWFFVAMPGLLLNYFGQGALMLTSQGQVENPLFQLAPDWFGIPLLVLATLATVVASQAMITGAFAVARQAIEIGYFPPMRIKSTSKKNSLHIFIPRLNIALMCVTLGLIVLFPSSERLAAAYGIAVAGAMMMTSLLFMIWMYRKSKWPRWITVPICLVFIVIDMSYFGTNLIKTFDGGWVPLVMGAFVLICMLTWHRGLEKIIERHMEFTEPIEEFAARVDRAPLAEVKHTGIFFSRTGIMAPVPMERLANMLHIKFEKIVIISIRIASRPRVEPEDRIQLVRIDKRILKLEIRYGYQQVINIPATIGPTLAAEGLEVDEALYIIGHERVISPMEPAGINDLMSILFAFLAATAERAVDRFQLPPSRTLEIGYPVHLKER